MNLVPAPQGTPSLQGAGKGNFTTDRSRGVPGGGPPPPATASLDFSKAANSQYLGTV
jgi:hypothetical protein